MRVAHRGRALVMSFCALGVITAMPVVVSGRPAAESHPTVRADGIGVAGGGMKTTAPEVGVEVLNGTGG